MSHSDWLIIQFAIRDSRFAIQKIQPHGSCGSIFEQKTVDFFVSVEVGNDFCPPLFISGHCISKNAKQSACSSSYGHRTSILGKSAPPLRHNGT